MKLRSGTEIRPITSSPIIQTKKVQPEQHNQIQTRTTIEKFYKEFEKMFDFSSTKWRQNKVHIGNGYFMYKNLD